MKTLCSLALALGLLAGCASDPDTTVVDEPVLGEAEAVTEVDQGPADDTLIVEEDTTLDPTYVPDEESVGSELTEGEMLEPEDG